MSQCKKCNEIKYLMELRKRWFSGDKSALDELRKYTGLSTAHFESKYYKH
jgi:hypothetical protein